MGIGVGLGSMGHHSFGPLLSTSASAIRSRKLITGGSRTAPQVRPRDLIAGVDWANVGKIVAGVICREVLCKTGRLPGYLAEINVAFNVLLSPLTVDTATPLVRRARNKR